MRIRSYEGMFLLDNHAAQADFEGTAGQVDAILEKHGATLVQKEKWDERKLAYEIKGQRRATYYLVYFQSDPLKLAEMREDLGLNEVVLRQMMFVLDLPIDEHIKVLAEEREKLAEDSRKHSLSGWGGRRGERGDRGDRGDRGGGRRSEGGGGGGRRTEEGKAEATAPAAAGAPTTGDA